MKRAVDSDEAGPFSELAIVDTFTRLIFGQEMLGKLEIKMENYIKELCVICVAH